MRLDTAGVHGPADVAGGAAVDLPGAPGVDGARGSGAAGGPGGGGPGRAGGDGRPGGVPGAGAHRRWGRREGRGDVAWMTRSRIMQIGLRHFSLMAAARSRLHGADLSTATRGMSQPRATWRWSTARGTPAGADRRSEVARRWAGGCSQPGSGPRQQLLEAAARGADRGPGDGWRCGARGWRTTASVLVRMRSPEDEHIARRWRTAEDRVHAGRLLPGGEVPQLEAAEEAVRARAPRAWPTWTGLSTRCARAATSDGGPGAGSARRRLCSNSGAWSESGRDAGKLGERAGADEAGRRAGGRRVHGDPPPRRGRWR